MDELEAGAEPLGRVRRPGGGRKRAAEVDPGLRAGAAGAGRARRARGSDVAAAVDDEVDPQAGRRADPPGPPGLARTRSGDLLREEGFSLQGNAKTLEGDQHPDRDAQFRYLNEQVSDHQDGGDPVISVDTKKKELVGPFKNGGREWRAAGRPGAGRHPRLPRPARLGKAIPYGIYDVAANTGWVNVGTDHDTAAFAVESIRRWWQARAGTTTRRPPGC